MHSAHRDLETRYKRVLTDLVNAQKTMKMQNEKIMEKNDEVIKLKTAEAENLTEISQKSEQLDSARRELNIKARQLKENDIRTLKI